MNSSIPEQVSVVAMQRRHVDLLMPFEQEMFGTEAWTRGSYLDELSDHQHRTYLAAEDAEGALLAWAGVRVLSGEAEIVTIGVVPSARRRGIARVMLNALLDAARGRGAVDLFLEVRIDNAAARALYASEGFADAGLRPGYYDHGRVDAMVMHRAL